MAGQTTGRQQDSHTQTSSRQNIIDSATRTINSWTGEDKSVHISLHDFFDQVWKKHSEAEAEEIFIAGTPQTTPSLAEVSSKPVQPWLYSRIFLGMVIAIALVGFLTSFFNNELGLLFVTLLAIAIPTSLLIFFFEINVFKNISFYLTIKVGVIGGIFSLLVTLCIYALVGSSGRFDLISSLSIGFVEETGKILVGAYFVSRLRLSHVFNGMLIGGAIGAGFAAFENLRYVEISGIINDTAIYTAILRSAMSIGTHSIWCAITVAALVLVNGKRQLTFSNVANLHFFRFFLTAIVLHGLWDWDVPISGMIKYPALIVAAWLVLFVLIHTGLREVKFIQAQLQAQSK